MVSCFVVKCLLLHLTPILLNISLIRPSSAQSANENEPLVTISQGILRGKIQTTIRGRNIWSFLGIPYAQPPIGNLRFANPVAANGWNGTRNATDDANICPQLSNNHAIVGKEDCLYLNIYVPQLSEIERGSVLLPVMVYIHGGAFIEGSSLSTLYGPEFLLDKDVLLVTMNYRLSALGFLSTGDVVASGNWALKDQVLALRWVQDNIAEFGGDREQVTIFGGSAGSASVHLLAISKATTGLFHRCITQSGSALSSWAYKPSSVYANRAFKLGNYVGCFNDTTESLISCLRTVDFSDIVASNYHFHVWETFPAIVWTSTDESADVEGAILTDSPANLTSTGKVSELSWMSGVVQDEGLLMTAALYENETMLDDLLDNFDTAVSSLLDPTNLSDSDAVTWMDALKSYYFNGDLTMNKNLLLTNLTRLVGDALFNYPAYNTLLQHQALSVNPQYFYTFNYRGSGSYSYIYGGSTVNYGVAHADELIYLFPKSMEIFGTTTDKDLKMVDIMVELWTTFATTGIPTTSKLDGITWEPYSLKNSYLRIGNKSEPLLEVQYSFLPERMEFWRSLSSSKALASVR